MTELARMSLFVIVIELREYALPTRRDANCELANYRESTRRNSIVQSTAWHDVLCLGDSHVPVDSTWPSLPYAFGSKIVTRETTSVRRVAPGNKDTEL
jgi:hypothetical protein